MHCKEILNDPSTHLCLKCQKLLLKHHALREELTALEGQINTIIEAIFSGVRACQLVLILILYQQLQF